MSPGKTRRRVLAPLLGIFVTACESAASVCAGPEDCDEGLACVFLAADADDGKCVEVLDGEGLPRDGFLEALYPDVNLDVLIVLDDSPAMAGQQAAIVGEIDRLAVALAALDRGAHLHIGVTTTDVGNPNCPGPPVDGALQMRSCRAHLDDFVDDAAMLDVAAACTDACNWDTVPVVPTSLYYGLDDPRKRPWIEMIFGHVNLAEGTDLATALRCAIPQGIAGCRYTSPLAAVQRVLQRSQDQDDPNYGFRRDDAYLAVLVLSAGNDCSLAPGHSDIFVDNPAFWGGLQPPDLSPAICWRAGVVCEGPGPVYAGCEAADFKADGKPASPEDAVLLPVSAVADTLRAAVHGEYGIGTGVAVLAIGGVPADATQPIPYADADDPMFQSEHGIGPGCEGPTLAAPPPVRLTALAAEFPFDERPPQASLCADELASIGDLGAALATFTRPGCVTNYCLEDTDPATPELDPSCEVSMPNDPIRHRTVPACVREGDAWVSPLGSPRCFIAHTGADLARQCSIAHLEVSLEIVSSEPEENVHYTYSCKSRPC